MATSDTSLPTFTQQVDQTVFIEPLGGPSDPASLLDRFPDELYDKSSETHFMRFMYSLLGPAGVGWIKKQYLDAKLKLYAQGFDTFDIERYYGDPFGFGRVLLEQLPDDPSNLLTREQWDAIKTRDESYRNRAIAFFNAARAGNSPLGMELAAQSGLNHAVFIIENYRYLFDLHSDEPLGLSHYGTTYGTEEFIVVPRQDTSASEIQVISFANTTAISGTFMLSFKGQTTPPIAWDASYFDVEAALQKLGVIGDNGVSVTGGPSPNPFVVTFTGPLSAQDVPQITVASSLQDNLGGSVSMSVRTLVGGVEPVDEVVHMSDEYQHNMQSAIDFLRPVNSVPTVSSGEATRTRQDFRTVHASSQYTEVIKFVTGSEDIAWPEPDSLNWIEPGKEKEARRIQGDLQQHYTAYHTPAGITAYTDGALDDPDYEELVGVLANYKSEHIGQYGPAQVNLFPFLSSEIDDSFVFSSTKALPPCSQPMEVTTQDDETVSPLIGGTVAAASIDNDGSGSIVIQSQRWWSSLERNAPAADFLEIDLGLVRVVNWISFDITRKPFAISLDFDYLDRTPRTFIGNSNKGLGSAVPVAVEVSTPRQYMPVTPWTGVSQGAIVDGTPYIAGTQYVAELPPWQQIRIFFRDQRQHNITTRFLRLKFARPEINPATDLTSPFIDHVSGLPVPYSVDIRNLRVGRYTGGHTPTWNDAG